jgi:hypothetical protein
MAALAAEKITPSRKGLDFSDPVEATTKIYGGGLVGINSSGNAVPMGSAAGLIIRGVAQFSADNSAGAAGDIKLPSRKGLFRLQQDSSIARANILVANAYAVDDQTVSLDATGGRALVGPIVDIDANGVWVDVGAPPLNGSKSYVSIDVVDVHGSGTYYGVAPVGGKVTKVSSVLAAAITTADATLTTKIAGVPITGGAIDVVQAASAAGQINTATPTAANTVTAGQGISVTVSGTEAADVAAKVIFEITH